MNCKRSTYTKYLSYLSCVFDLGPLFSKGVESVNTFQFLGTSSTTLHLTRRGGSKEGIYKFPNIFLWYKTYDLSKQFFLSFENCFIVLIEFGKAWYNFTPTFFRFLFKNGRIMMLFENALFLVLLMFSIYKLINMLTIPTIFS